MRNYTGIKFGKLTAIRPLYAKRQCWWWEFRCDCGITEKREARRVAEVCNNGGVPMCESCRKKAIGDAHRTHGLFGTHLYSVWNGMMQRCYNKNRKAFNNYGGRGIYVCDAWHTFENFYNDMHSTYEEGLELDRIDNNSWYCKENCRWVTRKENQRNTRKSLSVPIAMMAEQTGIPYKVLWARLHSGWSVEDLLLPVDCYKNKEIRRRRKKYDSCDA